LGSIVLNLNPHPFKTEKGAAPKGHRYVFVCMSRDKEVDGRKLKVKNGRSEAARSWIDSARGFLHGEHSIRAMREMRSNGGDANQVVGAVGFISRKYFFCELIRTITDQRLKTHGTCGHGAHPSKFRARQCCARTQQATQSADARRGGRCSEHLHYIRDVIRHRLTEMVEQREFCSSYCKSS
jgi:uncharacterized NAD(P)/FAD-binding protein YdhS